jgi:hypothetical protein
MHKISYFTNTRNLLCNQIHYKCLLNELSTLINLIHCLKKTKQTWCPVIAAIYLQTKCHYVWLILHCVYIPQFLDLFISGRESGLFPNLTIVNCVCLYYILSFFFFIFLLLFICAYKAWFISPHCPHPLPYHPLRSLPLGPLNTQQKLFCPYF